MKHYFSILLFASYAFLLTSCAKDETRPSYEKNIQSELRSNAVLCCTDAPLSNPEIDCGLVNTPCYDLVDEYIEASMVTPQGSGCNSSNFCWTAIKCHKAEYWYDYTSPYFFLDDGTNNCGGWNYGVKASTLSTNTLNNARMHFSQTNWQTGQPENKYCDLYFNYYSLPDESGKYSLSYWRYAIDSCDADLVDQHLAGQTILRAWQRMAGDVDADGDLDRDDSEMIRQMAGTSGQLTSFPKCSVSGAVGFGVQPYLYVNQKAYHVAASNWAVNNDQEKITRLAYINEYLPTRFINPVTHCKVANPWGAYNIAPYNLGLGRIVYVIKRGDVDGSHNPNLCFA